MRAQATAIPLSGPPGAVRLIVLELSGEEHRDENLMHGALDENDGDNAEHRV